MFVARGLWRLFGQTNKFLPVSHPLFCNDVCGALDGVQMALNVFVMDVKLIPRVCLSSLVCW